MPTHELHTTLINVAKKDLRLAKLAASEDDPYVEGVCFHCQQCAEKVLKAYLIYNGIKYKFIHDLKMLLQECEKIDNTLSGFETHCQILTGYSTDMRYWDDSEIDVKEMFEAIDLAEEVLNFVNDKLFK
ncbi:MAG: HEPN domain-containing protein [Candidatus Cloacimonetes bacterium]|nr:HEPN domain-containing protein [Candidatus Cloacimonadota bacterium]